MKNVIFNFLGIILCGGFLMFGSACTHEDQDIEEYIQNIPEPNVSTTELVAKKVTTAPVIDATVDPVWDEAKKLQTRATVPDPGDGVFEGYVGDSHEVTLRSLYDQEYIYFLAEWFDPNEDLNREPWYFDPATQRWAQEHKQPTFNEKGKIIRAPFYEDKFAMLWNVNNSVPTWSQTTCFASCHKGLGEENGFARHFTNGPNEFIDMWHWKSVRSNPNGQFDDQFQNNTQPNGRHGDTKDGGGYSNNEQELIIAATNDTVNVPKYVIPDKEYYYWILQSEIDNGTAKLITSVDENGVLTYDGGTIDPNVDTKYQREGSSAGPKGVPSIYTAAFEGNRGDIEGKGIYTGSGWVLEFRRKLKTGDSENQDIDFSSLTEQPFGIGVFDNASIAHAIKPNLKLIFEQ